MRKATQKTSPTSLGTKRSCVKCGTKFYDFNKEEIVCPKCDTKLDPQNLVAAPFKAPEPKKAAKLADADDVVVGGTDEISSSDESFESVDDLDDDDEDVVEDIDVEENEDDNF